MTDRRLIDGHPFVRHDPPRVPPDEGLTRGRALCDRLHARRSVRGFSSDPVPRAMIETAIRAAGSAPSGAHQQPWTFVAVSDPQIKARIRQAAEAEEQRNYEGGRMPAAWREAIAPLGTDAVKPYLEVAPWLVVVFVQTHGRTAEGTRKKHYYAKESVGLAAGLLLATLNEMGLATLTHTPSPMAFLSEVLGRPSNETAMLLVPVGYPADDCFVPDITRKTLDEISVFVE